MSIPTPSPGLEVYRQLRDADTQLNALLAVLDVRVEEWQLAALEAYLADFLGVPPSSRPSTRRVITARSQRAAGHALTQVIYDEAQRLDVPGLTWSTSADPAASGGTLDAMFATLTTSARSLTAWALDVARGTPCPLGCGQRDRGIIARARHLEVDHAGDPRPWPTRSDPPPWSTTASDVRADIRAAIAADIDAADAWAGPEVEG